MNDPEPRTPSPPGASPGDAVPKPEETGEARPLTPEEQMARFEEDLKNNDWGHQPC